MKRSEEDVGWWTHCREDEGGKVEMVYRHVTRRDEGEHGMKRSEDVEW
jgi:hypothetical protein